MPSQMKPKLNQQMADLNQRATAQTAPAPAAIET
jgi:hypothetical protein